MIWQRAIFFGISMGLMLSSQGFADVCPFVSQNGEVTALVERTKTSLEALRAVKNVCGDAYFEAVNSVRSLPSLLEDTHNPLSRAEGRRHFILSELAQAISRGDDAESIEVWKNDLAEVEESIRRIRMSRSDKKRTYEARSQALSMTENLLATLSDHAGEPDSDCARHIYTNFSSQVASVGLGAVSAVGPATTRDPDSQNAISLVAGVLSRLANFISMMPSDALADFDSDIRTLDLACLYNSIIQVSCRAEAEQTDSTSRENSRFKNYVLAEKEKMKDFWNTFDQVIKSKQAQNSKILMQSLSKILTGSGLSLEGGSEYIEDYNLIQTAEETTKDSIQRSLRTLGFIKKYLEPENFNRLSSEQRRDFGYVFERWVSNWLDSLKAEGIVVEKEDENGRDYSKQALFVAQENNIRSMLERRLLEAGGGGEDLSDNGIRAFNLGAWQPVHEALVTVEQSNAAIKAHAKASLKRTLKPIEKSQWEQLLVMVERSQKFTSTAKEWASLDPKSLGHEAYRKKVTALAGELVKQLKVKEQSKVTVENGIEVILFAPIQKFGTISSFKKGKTGFRSATDLLSDENFKTSLSPWETYQTLFSMLESRASSPPSISDRAALTRARDLFEGQDSPLKEMFSDGVAKIVVEASKSSNPEVARQEASELCALAQSLPKGFGGGSTISGCSSILPERFKKHKMGDEKPDCAYFRYLDQERRADYIKTRVSRPFPTRGTKGGGNGNKTRGITPGQDGRYEGP